MATHPIVRIAGPTLLTNPFYEPPELAECRAANTDGADERIEALSSPQLN